ncbi:MAG: hypothetical protein IJO87_09375 [Eggerthellaceae bacterium]|nr:hypothetical protein [Eggerthellaceae bacterium]
MRELLQLLCLVNARAVIPPEGFAIDAGDYAEFVGLHFAEYSIWLSQQVLELSGCPLYRAMALMLRGMAKA